MKICFTIDQTYLHGGIEKVLAIKANYLADVLQYDITIITTHQNNNKPQYPLSEKIRQVDLGIHYNRQISYFAWANLKCVPQHYRRLRKALQLLQPDVWVVCHYAVDFFFNPVIAKNLGIPVVKEYHGSAYKRFERQKANQYSRMDRWQLKAELQYSALVLLNEGELPFYQHPVKKVIPNPQPVIGTKAILSAQKVLAAGRVAPIKNFGRLIDIWIPIQKRFPDWELHIWGPDYLDTIAALKEKVNKAGLSGNIHFKGAIDDIGQIIDQYSIYAMTSDSECFPMVLLEAQSAGMPIIAFDVPTGPKYIIKDGLSGYLVNKENEEDYIIKLGKLMESEMRRLAMGKEGQLASETYLPSAIMQQWEQLFKDLKNA